MNETMQSREAQNRLADLQAKRLPYKHIVHVLAA
jgi:hypothetical protein